MTDASRETGRSAMKIITPFVYALVLVPAVAVTVLVGTILSRLVGTGFVWYALLVVSGLVVGAVVYAGIGRFLIASERSEQARFTDHVRRCAFLYVVLAVTLVWGISTYLATSGVGWPTFATEMQLHLISVTAAALGTDELIAKAVARDLSGVTTR